MDSQQFDDLLRSLSHSRRSALAVLLAASSGLGGAAGAAARKGRKKRKKKKKKRCTPKCSGKTCGADGCGGSCGACFGGTCTASICTCTAGYEVCRGACLVACPDMQQRNPDTCGCCIGSQSSVPCSSDAQCCSGHCDGGFCRGRNGQEGCTFDDQCASTDCRDGVCTCEGNTCGGVCRAACAPVRETRHPVTCACCVKNGEDPPCSGCGCCWSGVCNEPDEVVCVGRGAGSDCTFDAQCASGDCHPVSVGGDFVVLKCA